VNGSPVTAPPAGGTASAHRVGVALDVADLHVSIAGSHVLQGVTFQVPTGGVTALLGRNGVGKTTTLRSVLGLVAASGRVNLLGHDVVGWPTHRIIRLGVGYVPEDRDVFARLTVRENLRLAEAGPRPRYDDVYRLFPELHERGRQLAGTLSGGQQQMLAIGRVLLNSRPILLVDEPTKGLSPKYVSEVVSVLERVGDGATVLLVEQNVHVVRRLARTIVVLDQGRVVHAGAVADLEDEDLVRRLLGVSGAS
jgi:branched-chain amino acid transport system ATP-binding protein